MNELNFKRSWRSGVLSLLALLGVASVATEEAVAKIAVVRKTSSAAICPRRLGGSSSPEQEFALYCKGYPVLIKEDTSGKTLVYVKDDNENIPIESEKYLVEGDIVWSSATIYAGGNIGTLPRNVSVEMTGGYVGEIVLAGDSPNDQVNGDATLTVTGGSVNLISIMGPWFSGVNGNVIITLSDMTYNGSRLISEDKRAELSDDEWPIYYSDGVNITYNNCTFKNPWANPALVDPAANPNIFGTNCSGSVASTVAGHEYYIANITPDRKFADAGVATIKCKNCDKEWVITFGAYGGYTYKELTAYSYYVELASTLVPPTCVPGRGIYRLVLKINKTEITGEYESEIPPVDGVHNWGEDGICHEDHYETEMDADGSVIHDEFGNIVYALNDAGEMSKITEELENRPRLSYSYLRAGRKEQLLAGSNFSKLKRVVWDMQPFDTPSSALTRGMISGDYFQKDVVIGLNNDVVLDDDLISGSVGTTVQLDSARFINLHGHVLNAANHKLGVSGALTIMNGEVKNAEIVGLANTVPLTLDNATLTSNKIEWPGTRGILLRNGSMMSLSNEVSSSIVQMDEASTAVAKDGEEYTSNVETTVSSLKYTREFTHTNWQSLFVPFSIKVTSDILADCDIAAIKQMNFGDNTSLVIEKLEAGTTTEAGKPYFIRPKSIGEFSFEQAETILKPASDKTNIPINSLEEGLSFTFEGSYTANYQPTIPSGASWYALNNEGALQKASATSKIKNPGRWYVVRKTNNPEKASARMSILVLGEENIIDSQFILEDFDNNIYTPSGICVGKDRSALSAGIYVSGGKVFVVQ